MATGTYKVTNSAVPTYGENSSANKTLQEAVNKTGISNIAVDSKYGDQTKSAVEKLTSQGYKYSNGAFIKDTASDTTSSYLPRTTKVKEKSSTDKLLDTVYGSEAPDLESVREELTKNSQGIIDAITQQYANTISETQAAGEKLSKRQRAVNVGSGLGGSDFAAANAQAVDDKTLKAVQAVEAERDTKIQSILENVANNASTLYESKRKEYLQSAEDRIKMTQEFKDNALSDITSFAESGITSSQLKEKSPETWQQLIDQTGYDEDTLTAIFAASKNQEDQVFKEKVGNSIILGYRDPVTGKINTEKVNLGEGYTDFKIIDGVPYFIDLEGGKIKSALSGGTGGDKTTTSPSTGSKYTSGGLVTTTGKIAEAEKILDDSRGTDGYVDPDVYKTKYQEWIDGGGLLKDFLSKFPPKNYVNPANATLPAYLRNTSKASATTRAPLFE